MQVVHFDTPLQREQFSWVRGVNRFLPRDIAVQWAREVPAQFHARACAVSRRYAYVVLESAVRPSLDAGKVGWSYRSLSLASMHEAACHLLGTHDFTSFRAAECQAKTPVKTLLRADVQQHGHYWRFDFEADAFLHHMIRNMMGCLLVIGQGLQKPDWMRDVLLARNRRVAAPTFAPDGLYFVGPRYGAQWQLPDRTPAFDILPGA
jgi:tRNA pseudouridine38-40 synthase